MGSACTNCSLTMCSTCDQEAVQTGVSDTLVIRHRDGTLHATSFLVCFGPWVAINRTNEVQIWINNKKAPLSGLVTDRWGYMYPHKLGNEDLRTMNLQDGLNIIKYVLGEAAIEAEVYLYDEDDRLIVSDVDGTLTKNDIGGLLCGLVGKDYLHDGYAQLLQKAFINGYKVVWLTMRSLPLYAWSKQYIRQTVGVEGVLLMEPEQFLSAVSKEILKKTGNIKTNLMKELKKVYPSTISQPFVAGLGNRENDAIAYFQMGLSLQQIFIVDTKSEIQQMNSANFGLTYTQMADSIDQYFPKRVKAIKKTNWGGSN